METILKLHYFVCMKSSENYYKEHADEAYPGTIASPLRSAHFPAPSSSRPPVQMGPDQTSGARLFLLGYCRLQQRLQAPEEMTFADQTTHWAHVLRQRGAKQFGNPDDPCAAPVHKWHCSE